MLGEGEVEVWSSDVCVLLGRGGHGDIGLSRFWLCCLGDMAGCVLAGC